MLSDTCHIYFDLYSEVYSSVESKCVILLQTASSGISGEGQNTKFLQEQPQNMGNVSLYVGVRVSCGCERFSKYATVCQLIPFPY